MKTITYKELCEKQDKHENVLILNVLPRNEFLKEHITGSVSVPMDEKDFAAQVEQKAGSKSSEIVTYCAGPNCDASDKAAENLSRAGFTNVQVYKGGMQEWHEHRSDMAA